MREMIRVWKNELKKLSGNLTTNEFMPNNIAKILLEEDISLENKLSFKEIKFPKPSSQIMQTLKGLNILAGLQKIQKKDCLTVYRAVRFPTYKRIHTMLRKSGCAIPNYEQERILKLYENKNYSFKRKKIQKDGNFWTQPQERVVPGLPVFSLVNDALQIHRAFRNKEDKVAMIVIHVPFRLLRDGKIKLIANAAIDLDYGNDGRDFEIREFVRKNNSIDFDYCSLRSRGIDLHEMYLKNLPWSLAECDSIGITQEFFLLDTYEIQDEKKRMKLFNDTEALKKYRYFLYGFFGDQNIFGRRESHYLPSKCYKIALK
jgi:hypothetical protein